MRTVCACTTRSRRETFTHDASSRTEKKNPRSSPWVGGEKLVEITSRRHNARAVFGCITRIISYHSYVSYMLFYTVPVVCPPVCMYVCVCTVGTIVYNIMEIKCLCDGRSSEVKRKRYNVPLYTYGRRREWIADKNETSVSYKPIQRSTVHTSSHEPKSLFQWILFLLLLYYGVIH